jgi:tetratricopeptide (TPR) repeat protein
MKFMDVPCESLQRIIDGCLEKDKTRRLQTATEMAELLRQAQIEYRQSNVATVCGVKTSALPQMEESGFQMTPPPAAIGTRKPLTGPGSVPPASASAPTELMNHSPAATFASGAGPTELLSHPPVLPASPTTGAETFRTAGASVKPGGTARTILIAAVMIIFAGLAGAGIYYYLSHNLQKQNPISEKKASPAIPGKETEKKEQPAKEDYSQELAKAKALHQASKYEEAVAAYDEILKRHPSDSNLHFLRGVSKLKMKKTQEALLAFQKSVELDDRMVPAWHQIGFLLMNRMDYQGAEEAFRRAIAIDPTSAPGWEGLAQTYLMTQRQVDAEQAYKKLLELEPQNIAAIYNLGQLQWAGKDTAGAMSSFEKVLELNPNHAEAHNNLGAIYLAEGMTSQAIRENELAVQLKPGLASAHYSLFLAYEQEKNFKVAGEHLRKYLEITEDDDPELKRKAEKYNH